MVCYSCEKSSEYSFISLDYRNPPLPQCFSLAVRKLTLTMKMLKTNAHLSNELEKLYRTKGSSLLFWWINTRILLVVRIVKCCSAINKKLWANRCIWWKKALPTRTSTNGFAHIHSVTYTEPAHRNRD